MSNSARKSNLKIKREIELFTDPLPFLHVYTLFIPMNRLIPKEKLKAAAPTFQKRTNQPSPLCQDS